jgi:small GTP-binding protein
MGCGSSRTKDTKTENKPEDKPKENVENKQAEEIQKKEEHKIEPEQIVVKKAEPSSKSLITLVKLEEAKKEGKEKLDQLTVVVIGEKQAGKTSIFNRLAYKKYDDDYKVTEEVTIMERNINIDKAAHKMKLIDTPGLNKGEINAVEHVKTAHIVIFVYDITGKNLLTLDETDFEKAKAFIATHKSPVEAKQVWVLAGNKIDLPREYR